MSSAPCSGARGWATRPVAERRRHRAPIERNAGAAIARPHSSIAGNPKPMRKLVLSLTAVAALSTAAVTAYAAARPHARHAAATTGHPRYGAFGFDLAGMDRNVAPGESFYRYANGNW